MVSCHINIISRQNSWLLIFGSCSFENHRGFLMRPDLVPDFRLDFGSDFGLDFRPDFGWDSRSDFGPDFGSDFGLDFLVTFSDH